VRALSVCDVSTVVPAPGRGPCLMHVMQRTARQASSPPARLRGARPRFPEPSTARSSVPCLASSSGPGFVSFRSPLAGARGGGSGRDERRRQRHLVLQPFFPSLSMQSKFLPPLREAEAGTPCAAARLARHVVNSFTHSDVIAWAAAAAAQAREAGEGEGDDGGWVRGCHLRKRKWKGKGKGQKGRGEKRREKAVV